MGASGSPAVPSEMPTAAQKARLTHDTLRRDALWPSGGVGTTDHEWPFHLSANPRVSKALPEMATVTPTAMQNFAVTHDAPKVRNGGFGSGLFTADHLAELCVAALAAAAGEPIATRPSKPVRQLHIAMMTRVDRTTCPLRVVPEPCTTSEPLSPNPADTTCHPAVVGCGFERWAVRTPHLPRSHVLLVSSERQPPMASRWPRAFSLERSDRRRGAVDVGGVVGAARGVRRPLWTG
jgi:hypothetical protein